MISKKEALPLKFSVEDYMDYKSALNLEKLVFDKIHFERLGFKNDNQLNYRFESHFAKKNDEEIYRVTLIYRGNKENEYTMEISLTGFFTFRSENQLSDEIKKELVNVNAVSILMPYLRSQISLVTAQPEMDCVVLPPFNINNMLQSQDEE